MKPALLIKCCIAAAGLLPAGCAAEPDATLIQKLSLQLNAPRTIPATFPAEALSGPLGPDDYARLAVERNPMLVAAAARVRRLAARGPRARSLDDPMFSVTPVGRMAETAAGRVDAMLGLSQKFLLPAKLDARGTAADLETAAALAGLERTRQEVAAGARRAFWDYWLADRRLAVTRQSRDLLANLREAATAQLRAGRAGQASVLRAETELTSLENELVDLEQAKSVNAAALNRLLDRPPTAALPEPTDADPPATGDDDLGRLLADAVRNPLLAARTADVNAARQRLRLARLNDWPDLTLSANYGLVGDDGLAIMANGRDQWSIGFGINLPIWRERRRAAIREERAAVAEAVARLDAERNDVAYAARKAAADLDAARRMVRLLDDSVLPQARQTVEATAAAYRAGDDDFLSYLDAWRRLLDFELSQREAVGDLGRAAADLDLALGRDPTSQTRPYGPEGLP